MATRQYIGARYVPKFAEPIEWVKENSYEALTIVTYLNNSYTSKKKVPANTEITNTDYWVVTGNYNAQVEQYREEVEANNAQVEQYREEVEANNAQVEQYREEVEANNAQVEQYHEEVEAYKAIMKKPSGNKKFIFIGDSYGHASDTNEGWIDKIVTMLNLTTNDYYENALGGASFGSTSNNFITLLQNLSSSITDKNSITDIVVLGGANERGFGVDVITTAVDTFVSYVNVNYPNAVVKIGFIGGTNDITVRELQYSRGVAGYSASKACYLNNLEYVLFNTDYLERDGIHPTSDGYDALAKHIYGALLGDTNVSYVMNTLTSNFLENIENSSFNVTPNVYVSLKNNDLSVAFDNNIDVNFNTPISFTYNQSTNVCKIRTPFLFGGYSNKTFKGIDVTLHSSANNTNYSMTGVVCISSYGNIAFTPTNASLISSTSAFNSIDRIIIPRIAFTTTNY